jgi:hypothetical protein
MVNFQVNNNRAHINKALYTHASDASKAEFKESFNGQVADILHDQTIDPFATSREILLVQKQRSFDLRG